ncbi:hypothetical protein [Paractinoplanes maris]|uniref:hypothetical protein n=1 Tax=Paractinoplanes maris TaxID=1734446 RepID=UPI002021AD92|nr:hypothetical protein [Actinoplanes maris]
MFDNLVVRARTALSPEWDRGFDEAFAELVSSDPDLVQAEFDELIAASWPDSSGPAPPPAPSSDSASLPGGAAAPAAVTPPDEPTADPLTDRQRPPP